MIIHKNTPSLMFNVLRIGRYAPVPLFLCFLRSCESEGFLPVRNKFLCFYMQNGIRRFDSFCIIFPVYFQAFNRILELYNLDGSLAGNFLSFSYRRKSYFRRPRFLWREQKTLMRRTVFYSDNFFICGCCLPVFAGMPVYSIRIHLIISLSIGKGRIQ